MQTPDLEVSRSEPTGFTTYPRQNQSINNLDALIEYTTDQQCAVVVLSEGPSLYVVLVPARHDQKQILYDSHPRT